MPNNQVSPQNAFEKLFNQFIEGSRPKLLAYVLRLLPVSEAEEVLQEAHLKFYYITLQQASLDNEKQSIAQYTPLLFSIAKNLALSRIRHHKVVLKHQQRVESTQTNTGESVELSLLENDEKERLQAAITNLPPMCRQVFIQRKIHNKSHAEIANTFNITTKTVENHIARGLKLCRKFMISSRANFVASSAVEQSFKKGNK
jgi:RNA polymerase sigma-70 factor (ECF subfamily)